MKTLSPIGKLIFIFKYRNISKKIEEIRNEKYMMIRDCEDLINKIQKIKVK